MTVLLVSPAEALKSEFIMASEASFNLPHDLALSPDGRYLYVADNGNDRIAVLDPNTLKVIGADYKLLGTIGSGKPGKDPGQLNTPEGVAVFGKDVWISDTYNNRIVRYQITE
jgi:DNA-binding beta-propeller fold protein YncE